MNADAFFRVYSDENIRGFVSNMAKRLSPTPEVAKDCEQEAWLAIFQAPEGIGIGSLKDAIVTSVASVVWQERKPRRAAKAWIRVLKENLPCKTVTEQS